MGVTSMTRSCRSSLKKPLSSSSEWAALQLLEMTTSTPGRWRSQSWSKSRRQNSWSTGQPNLVHTPAKARNRMLMETRLRVDAVREAREEIVDDLGSFNRLQQVDGPLTVQSHGRSEHPLVRPVLRPEHRSSL